MNELTDNADQDPPHRGRPILKTPRLQLVPLAAHHLEYELELDSDPQVLRYLYGRALTRGEALAAHRRRLAAGRRRPGLGFWVGFQDSEFVGWWILQPPHGPDQPQVDGEADLGYRLLRRCWRKGLASEGARELLRYGFMELRLNRIFAQTLAVNIPSRAVMRSLGMTLAREFPATEPDPLVAGSELGEVEFEITRQRWSLGSELSRAR
jgi:RimJ/RimL family protein N-acetyltransferase